jgi:hypothetical protein
VIRGEAERLGLAPVDRAVRELVAATLELAHELLVRREPVGDAEQLVVQVREHVGCDRGDDLVRRGGRDTAFGSG